jgi:hypothetical protein
MADPAMTEMGVILKRAPIGSNLDDYSVLDEGVTREAATAAFAKSWRRE